MRITDLLTSLEAEERAFLATETLAPVLRGRRVAVRIAGILCELAVNDARFEGWAILRPLALDRAQILRRAGLGELARYLRLFPAVRLIALPGVGSSRYALPAQRGDLRLRADGPLPVYFVEERAQPFETLIARFDGRFCWYERRDGRRNPALAAYLREAFVAETPTEELHRAGLSAEERVAYAWSRQALHEAQRASAEEQARRQAIRTTGRLSAALAHAGAQLVAHIERNNAYTVTYTVDGQKHTSVIRANDLSVRTAGICLSGRDADFDLTSLVGVLREGTERRRIVPMGVYGDEDDE